LGVRWIKSWHSNGEGNCVEVAGLGDGSIEMRNSRDPERLPLVYAPAEITAFLAPRRESSATSHHHPYERLVEPRRGPMP
jgi:hypothetical protein